MNNTLEVLQTLGALNKRFIHNFVTKEADTIVVKYLDGVRHPLP